MKLTDAQQATVQQWAAEGATLNDIQNKLRDEMGLRLTFMEVRFLVLDLKIELISPKTEEPAEPATKDEAIPDHDPEMETDGVFNPEFDDAAVALSVDEITIPGTMISGKVTFSDGVLATWYLDQMGRLGLQAGTPGYQPPAEDVESFQTQLKAHLRRLGMY
jgi:hypothetical protein